MLLEPVLFTVSYAESVKRKCALKAYEADGWAVSADCMPTRDPTGREADTVGETG